MAGSYGHLRAGDGSFQFDLIENLGDAHEACEMTFWMIGFLANGDAARIAEAEEAYYRHCRGESP